MAEYQVYRISDLATIEMRITAQLVSRGVLVIDERNSPLTPEREEWKQALLRRVRDLAPRVNDGEMKLSAAVDEIAARPYGSVQ
ncbi:MAG: hypothetical protein AAFO80_08215 [Pseudomonadota bacterium]